MISPYYMYMYCVLNSVGFPLYSRAPGVGSKMAKLFNLVSLLKRSTGTASDEILIFIATNSAKTGRLLYQRLREERENLKFVYPK